MLGRRFAHHPAHGINSVGFTTTIRADDAGQIARKMNRGRVYKRLKSGEFNSAKAHE